MWGAIQRSDDNRCSRDLPAWHQHTVRRTVSSHKRIPTPRVSSPSKAGMATDGSDEPLLVDPDSIARRDRLPAGVAGWAKGPLWASQERDAGGMPRRWLKAIRQAGVSEEDRLEGGAA